MDPIGDSISFVILLAAGCSSERFDVADKVGEL